MLRASIDKIKAIELGIKPQYIVKVYWQVPETYTADDHLISVGDITTTISGEGAYEVSNTTIELSNSCYYFSDKLQKELPNNKLVEIYIHADILLYRAIVTTWELTDTRLRLNTNA